MSRFVLDCSISIAWFLEDQSDSYSDRVLKHALSGSAIAPAIWFYETANSLVVAERRKLLKVAQTAWILEQLRIIPIEVEEAPDPAESDRLVAVAREQRLSVYDAAYVELGMRLGIPLASNDDKLCAAAQRCGIGLFTP